LLEEEFRSLGVGEDSAEGLVQFMGQRGCSSPIVDTSLCVPVPSAVGAAQLRPVFAGDIAKHTKDADRAARSAALSYSGQVVDPLLPEVRMQVTILGRDPIDPPVMQLLTLVQQKLEVAG